MTLKSTGENNQSYMNPEDPTGFESFSIEVGAHVRELVKLSIRGPEKGINTDYEMNQ